MIKLLIYKVFKLLGPLLELLPTTLLSKDILLSHQVMIWPSPRGLGQMVLPHHGPNHGYQGPQALRFQSRKTLWGGYNGL